MTEINLLATDTRKEKKFSPFLSISLLIFLISVIVVVVALLYLLFLKNTMSTLAINEKGITSDLSQLEEQRVKLLTTRERLSVIGKIFPSSREFSQRVGLIVHNIPLGMTVDTIHIEGNKASIKLIASSLATFNAFFNTTLMTLPQQKNSGIKKIDILSFSINKNGGYTASIEITYNSALTE